MYMAINNMPDSAPHDIPLSVAFVYTDKNSESIGDIQPKYDYPKEQVLTFKHLPVFCQTAFFLLCQGSSTLLIFRLSVGTVKT